MRSDSRTEIERKLPVLMPRLWRFALSLTRREDAADDLVQSACVRMLEKSGAYEANTHFDRWAFTVMANLWRSELRRQGAVRYEAIEDAEPIEDVSCAAADDVVYHNQVLAAIDALPADHRAAVTLVYGEGYSYREAAEILGAPIGTIMSRLHAARQKLKRLMQSA